MIDLVGLANLFFEASKEWTEPHVERIDTALMEKEPIFQKLKSEGHEFQWHNQLRLRQSKHNGWKPVDERDKIGRPTIFTDPSGHSVLLHRVT